MDRLPRWFRIVFVAVMIALCVTVVTQIPRQARLRSDISLAQEELSFSQQRLEKQLVEFEQIRTDLPLTEAELARVSPEAEAIYTREQELREQRKALRAENEAQAAAIAELEAQLYVTSGEHAAIRERIENIEAQLVEWQSQLNAIKELVQ
ncbi:MAG: hypothetical protein IJ438_08455 [Clostridia bacterium]|nr:hypothetical protein [Clostridia bacterium]